MNKESAIQAIEEELAGELENVKSELCSSNRDQRMNHYLNTYCSLLKVSQSLCIQANGDPGCQSDAIVAISHMAYGWMPTTLKKCDINGDIGRNGKHTILDAFDVKSSGDARKFVEGFESSPINDSCIGLSKSLHFINPEFFPIWDSKVAEKFEVHHHYQMKKINIYGCYIEFCHSVLVDRQAVAKAVKKVQDLFCRCAGYKVEKIRALEFILFVAEKSKK